MFLLWCVGTLAAATPLPQPASLVTANRELGTGNRELGTGNRELGTGNRQPGRAGADTVVTVYASGSGLEFAPAELSLKQGTRVRLRFVNEGTLPHNFVLVLKEADVDTLAALASKAGGDYVPLVLKEKLAAWTKLASPGETVETSFVVPPAGEYTFVCMMSGHANVMLGKLRSLR